ncbi:MAG: hypothetical protein DMF83_28400 [Acidobacteria bacterium]|nr:MAG: hypothetical protein DMF83_28400 [Acidobacteriota bacterium]
MTRALLVLALLVLTVGCASSSPPPQQHPRAGSSPRVRCLTNPNETELRPLFFLFCVESP